MLVAPVSLGLCKVGPLFRLRWWVGDLCDEERSRRFSDAINENTEQRNLEEDKEANSEPEENTFAVVEPDLLLLRSVANAREVGLELRMVSAVR